MANDQLFKVTVWYYHRAEETYRNQTAQNASAWERMYNNEPTVVKGVRVEKEPRLKSVKDE